MSLLQLDKLVFARRQLLSLEREIAALATSEFPYEDSSAALRKLQIHVVEQRAALDLLTSDSAEGTIDSNCEVAFDLHRRSLPLLGFILRSTNTRNAFEVWGPMRRLARAILGNNSRLVLSSEWEFSPYTFVNIQYVPGFVFLGLPATESSNAFLLGLAGHELGHSLWRNSGVGAQFEVKIKDVILAELEGAFWEDYKKLHRVNDKQDLSSLLPQPWWNSVFWAKRQAEETFCDFVGLWLFGEAFLYSMAYLFAPSRQAPRYVLYPPHRTRAKNLLNACTVYECPPVDGYIDMFAEQNYEEQLAEIAFLQTLADKVLPHIVDELVSAANEHLSSTSVDRPIHDLAVQSLEDLKLVVPIDRDDVSVAEILNAGWTALLDDNWWASESFGPEIDQEELLNDLLLKSLELNEIHYLQSQPTPKSKFD